MLAAQSQHAVAVPGWTLGQGGEGRGARPDDTLTFWKMHFSSNHREADTLAPNPTELGGVRVAMEMRVRSDSPSGCRSLECLAHLVTSYKGPP